MKLIYLESQTKGKQIWFTITLWVIKLSIATLGFKKFSLRLSIEYGW